MESIYHQSGIYSSAGAPQSPYVPTSSYATEQQQQHPQLPPPPYRSTTTSSFFNNSHRYTSINHTPHSYGSHDMMGNAGAADPYSPVGGAPSTWSSSATAQQQQQQQHPPQASSCFPSYMSPPALPSPMSAAFRRGHSGYGSGHAAAAAAGCFGGPCSPTDNAFGHPTPPAPIQRPKLTTTVWEDEATVCYQVDAKNICVARRRDNDMVNGTKLLNVVGMSRGKRDGILKNEKGRVVVKVGAMHLKGVWITFSRAKDLATKFKIVDLLYPLFTDDPSQFLCTTSDSGLSVPSGDTASVETAQTSSTVKSLVGPPPPPSGTTHSMSPYKTDLSSYHYMPPSWENRPPYSSLANNDSLRSQDMPATSTPYNGMLNGTPAGVPRPSSFGGLTHPPPSTLEDDPFMARRSGGIDEPSVARFPSSPPPEKYAADQSIHPPYIYDSENHHAEVSSTTTPNNKKRRQSHDSTTELVEKAEHSNKRIKSSG
ncbi:related to ascospore maturation 1 protein [Lichtheimia corymbifera JMRC:FSU:9682]|uniref:Related to ascospore maturation 1 protein n=1 Tax=Lichtheimia corymbifera JMRC:FSU:9682 TaxID=1263082 RepID=A0A068S488_9FUNG|nr:related to ascospore maturation 1 protein [Lichtheimia corymbifera JMRC:FSU:9682]